MHARLLLLLLLLVIGCPTITDVSPFASIAADDDDSVSDDDDSVGDDDDSSDPDDDDAVEECDLSWITEPADPVSFSADLVPMFEFHCDPCHTFQKQGGLQLFGNDVYDNLVNVPNSVLDGLPFSGQNYVTPGDAENSYLLHKISGCDPGDETWGFFQGPMPPATAGAPLSEEQISQIWSWVVQGAEDN